MIKRNSIKSFVSVAVMFAVIAATSTSEATTYIGASGAQCHLTTPGENGNYSAVAEYGVYGLQSVRLAGFSVTCPISVGTTTVYPQSISDVIVGFKDGNNAADSSGGALACYVGRTNWNGSAYYSTTRYSCSTTGGCTGTLGSATFTGTTHLQFTSSDLGSNITGVYLDSNTYVQCSVPGIPMGSSERSAVIYYYSYY
jgi:hypothetical protein